MQWGRREPPHVSICKPLYLRKKFCFTHLCPGGPRTLLFSKDARSSFARSPFLQIKFMSCHLLCLSLHAELKRIAVLLCLSGYISTSLSLFIFEGKQYCVLVNALSIRQQFVVFMKSDCRNSRATCQPVATYHSSPSSIIKKIKALVQD